MELYLVIGGLIILNVAMLFLIDKQFSLDIALMISALFLILFFSQIYTDSLLLKAIILPLLIYKITILLMFNNPVFSSDDNDNTDKDYFKKFQQSKVFIFIIFGFLLLFSYLFSLPIKAKLEIKNDVEAHKINSQDFVKLTINNQNKNIKNSDFYNADKSTQIRFDDQNRNVQIKNYFAENIFLKNSTNFIIIIVGIFIFSYFKTSINYNKNQ